MKPLSQKRLTIAIAFQLCWFFLVLSASSNVSLIATLVSLVIAVSIFYKCYSNVQLLPLLAIAILGFCFDLLMHAVDIIHIQGNQATGQFWLLSLWVLFVTCFSYLFFWLTRLPTLLIGLVGALGGLVSYYAAALLGALQITLLVEFVIAYSIFWGLGFFIASKILIAKQLTKQNYLAQDAQHK